MKQEKRFNIGERIFAKVRGYPPWPAKVSSIKINYHQILITYIFYLSNLIQF